MRRFFAFAGLLCVLFLSLSASFAQEEQTGKILVFIEETEHVTVQENGKWIQPG